MGQALVEEARVLSARGIKQPAEAVLQAGLEAAFVGVAARVGQLAEAFVDAQLQAAAVKLAGGEPELAGAVRGLVEELAFVFEVLGLERAADGLAVHEHTFEDLARAADAALAVELAAVPHAGPDLLVQGQHAPALEAAVDQLAAVAGAVAEPDAAVDLDSFFEQAFEPGRAGVGHFAEAVREALAEEAFVAELRAGQGAEIVKLSFGEDPVVGLFAAHFEQADPVPDLVVPLALVPAAAGVGVDHVVELLDHRAGGLVDAGEHEEDHIECLDRFGKITQGQSLLGLFLETGKTRTAGPDEAVSGFFGELLEELLDELLPVEPTQNPDFSRHVVFYVRQEAVFEQVPPDGLVFGDVVGPEVLDDAAQSCLRIFPPHSVLDYFLRFFNYFVCGCDVDGLPLSGKPDLAEDTRLVGHNRVDEFFNLQFIVVQVEAVPQVNFPLREIRKSVKSDWRLLQ